MVHKLDAAYNFLLNYVPNYPVYLLFHISTEFINLNSCSTLERLQIIKFQVELIISMI